ncbi:MAG: peptide-methionine (R)-S-oxide reductase MsrB [Chthoniobacter sp.]|nr:peptide-methionine (R)-S-oxide reductase MsrB [Chthoniobacter sp.]
MKFPIRFPLFVVASVFALAVQVQAADPTPADDKGKTKEAAPMNKEELRKKLTPQQYQVACEGSTEPAFHNAYWNNHEPGIYVDVISGEPLFASTDKFDSGTGWPSFTRTLKKEAIVEKKDDSFGMIRTEVRSSKSDAHLGHVFNDGPAPTGMRYCINSASLRFIPVAQLKEKGYGEYLELFEKKGEAGKAEKK